MARVRRVHVDRLLAVSEGGEEARAGEREGSSEGERIERGRPSLSRRKGQRGLRWAMGISRRDLSRGSTHSFLAPSPPSIPSPAPFCGPTTSAPPRAPWCSPAPSYPSGPHAIFSRHRCCHHSRPVSPTLVSSARSLSRIVISLTYPVATSVALDSAGYYRPGVRSIGSPHLA